VESIGLQKAENLLLMAASRLRCCPLCFSSLTVRGGGVGVATVVDTAIDKR